MLDNKTSSELASIARSGGSLEVDGSKYTSNELASVARNLVDGQAHLKVFNSRLFSSNELASIARQKPGQVIFT